jgi:hypothetical protein
MYSISLPLLASLVSTSAASHAKNNTKLELKPLIPNIVEPDVAAIVAYWEVKTFIGDPKALTNTIDRRSMNKEQPFRRFYDTLKGYRDDPELVDAWSCAKLVPLQLDHAKSVASLIVPEKEVERISTMLVDLSASFTPSIKQVREFESIKRLNANYSPALLKLAKLRMQEISSSCAPLKAVMAEIEESLNMLPSDICGDNERAEREMEGGGEDRAPLIAMTVIGLASIVVNILQGVLAASQAPVHVKSPLLYSKK